MDTKSEDRMLDRAIETLIADLPFGVLSVALLAATAYGIWAAACAIFRAMLS